MRRIWTVSCGFLPVVAFAMVALAAAPPRAAQRPPAAEPDDADVAPSFARDVMPTLGRECERCHGAEEQHGGLRLDNYEWLMRGGDAGPVIVPGDPKGSLLLAKIERRHRPPMPPRKRLPKSVVARIRAWIAGGAQP